MPHLFPDNQQDKRKGILNREFLFKIFIFFSTQRNTTARAIVRLPENGLDMDTYSDVVMDQLSQNDRNNVINKFEAQKAESAKVTDKYRSFIVNKTVQDQLKKDNNPENWKKLSKEMEQLLLPYWLHVQFPSIFRYTGAGQLNNLYQGFMHTFVRHWDQWQDYIPELRSLIINELLEIKDLLDEILNARNKDESGNAINKLNRKLASLNSQVKCTAINLILVKKFQIINIFLF